MVALDAGDRLNALTLDTVTAILRQLTRWKVDERIAVVVLHANSDKAFCAGGDLRELYTAQSKSAINGGGPDASDYAKIFFEHEYRLDHELHRFVKPVLCWGHGVVMGGGLGLLVGCSHRVVTEASRLSMPEIAIGHFPDVAASWFLNRMPDKSGLFAGLTGAAIHAADAVFAKLADYVISQALKKTIFDQLLTQDWSTDRHENDALLGSILRSAQQLPAPPGPRPLYRNCDLVAEICARETVPAIVEEITALKNSTDPWLQDGASRLARGYAGSAWLVHDLLKRTSHLSLAEIFQIEYGVALRSIVHGQFLEGIRAMIIDKDRRPRWDRSIDEIDSAWIAETFLAPLPVTQNPLADLGTLDVGPDAKTWG
jgi:enoyl-CoA hydratase/carnithine racemase